METIGQFLKREREFRGITLEEVSRSTKVTVTVLKNLEADRTEYFPHGPFMKGLLKSYGQYVGLNVDDLLLRYQTLFPGAQETTPLSLNPKKDFSFKRQSLWIFISAGLLVIFLVAYFASR